MILNVLDKASGLRPDLIEGRWVVETKHRRRAWEIIVEPDERDALLVVVTAYPLETKP